MFFYPTNTSFMVNFVLLYYYFINYFNYCSLLFFLPKSPSNMSFSLMNNSLNNKNVKIWIWWR